MKHQSEWFTAMQSRLMRLPMPLRALLITWIVAGTAYVLADPSEAYIPPIIGLAIVAPLLISVALLMAWNIYRLFYWAVGPRRQ